MYFYFVKPYFLLFSKYSYIIITILIKKLFMKTILLVPIFLYLILLLVNIDLLKTAQDVNIFWFTTIHTQWLLFSSIFIALYATLVYFLYNWVNAYLKHKISNLEKEIVELKSDLYDWQEELIDNIKQTYDKLFEEFKKENDINFKKIIELDQNILDKIISISVPNSNISEIELDRYKKKAEKILANKWFNSEIIEKLKIWK